MEWSVALNSSSMMLSYSNSRVTRSGSATLNLPLTTTQMKVTVVIELASTQLEWAELIKRSQLASWNAPCVQWCSDPPVSDAAHLARLPSYAAAAPVCNRLLLGE